MASSKRPSESRRAARTRGRATGAPAAQRSAAPISRDDRRAAAERIERRAAQNPYGGIPEDEVDAADTRTEE